MVKKFIFISLVLFYLFSDLNATHIRAGEIIAKRISSTSLTYEFTIIGYTDTGSEVEFGGGKFDFVKELVESIGGTINMDKFRKAVEIHGETFDYSGFDLIKASVDYISEAEYRGKKVKLNKPKRGGSKKFYVYVKSKKGNVKKVSFGDTNLSVKLKQRGARASFAARHKCAQKKDKTKAGYWSCNIGRYWKSLGGGSNFSGYW